MAEDQAHLRRLLEELESGADVSQRRLAARLGIALGRVNRLLRVLVRAQWVRSARAANGRLEYVVTHDGAKARARLTREHLGLALRSYSAVRDRVRDGLAACRADGTTSNPPAVALYGTGEVAHIVFACAAELGLPLIGFVDDTPRESYMGLPVRPPDGSMSLDGRTFDWLFVATLTEQDAVRARLLDVGFPLERVRWL
jgi:DNA-binding MarR family transcriptional regulator